MLWGERRGGRRMRGRRMRTERGREREWEDSEGRVGGNMAVGESGKRWR